MKSKTSQANLDIIFAQAPVSIRIIARENYTIEYANDYYLHPVDKEKTIMGKPLFEVFPELISQGIKEIIDGVFATGKIFSGLEHELIIKQDDKIVTGYFNLTYKPIIEDDGSFNKLLLVATDVTEQVLSKRKSEQSEFLYHEMIFSSPSMIAIFKGENMIVEIANESILEMWGKGKEVIGQSFFEILPEILEQGFDDILMKVYVTGIAYNAHEMPIHLIRNGKKQLHYFNFSYQAQRNINGQIVGIGLIANEVTPQAIDNIKLKENELYFRLMAELMPDKITNATPRGKVIYYNKGWSDYTGATIDELASDGWSKWIHEEEVPECTKRWLKALKTGGDFDMELRMLNKNGEYRWHTSKARSVKEENGKVKLWLGINSDIHDQKMQKEALEAAVILGNNQLRIVKEELIHKNEEAEDSKAKLMTEYSRRLIEASLDPLITISIEGKIMDLNQAFINATGKTNKELMGSNFYDYFTDVEKAKTGYKEIFDKGFVFDLPLIIKDHKFTSVLFNGSVYKDEHGKVLGAVLVARDITVQNRIEKELIEAKLFAEMATNIAETAKLKAEEATYAAEEAARTKQQFLSNMSHEIRTPMNAIIGFTKVVLRTELTAKQKEYLTAIKISGDSLIVLINDILDLAKVDSGKMTFEETPFKLSLSINAMLHLFETKIHEKNLILNKKYDENIPDVLLGDPIRLHQIILNLVSNSVKFTSHGKITVSVSLLEEHKENVIIEFSVSDTGIGIAENKMGKIFENFQQESLSTSRIYGGTGLGLAIVKQLVEGQGGSISVKSMIDVGSTFSFKLQFKKTNAEAILEPEIIELDREIKDVKVLVVEDMALNQLLMKTLLDDFGFECDIAANGKLAIEKLEHASLSTNKTSPYDIILMDLQMPEMNGFEATEYIRKTLKSSIPIIALTADVTTMDLAKCKEIGMDDYLAKPVEERLLYSKIVNFIKKPMIILTEEKLDNNAKPSKVKYVDLSYLLHRTKANPKLMVEMISLYLEQTPPLIFAMKQSLNDKDWKLLQSVIHKMIPSFSIMGMSTDFEEMAHKIQEYANTQLLKDGIYELVHALENACNQACIELQHELTQYNKLKTN
jgi:PAS domain S-box-containing protein